ncbi:MAG: N-acetylglucosamine-6-phosphate deacetylase, partial [Deltaproteobacteria bacterium]|nr:N-acetylglucosamine-6-phosphate deacetylase [Deltaproteobacteria bacterium]
REVITGPEFKGRLPGFHLEGPFLSPQPGAIGAHNPDWVREPDPRILDDLQTWAGGQIRLITIAAEASGAEALCRHAVDLGIKVFLGHHLARVEDLRRLAAAGATGLTHLGNGLPAQVNRHHNPIWAGLAVDTLAATFITDGHHLPPYMLQSLLRAKGLHRSAVVSDAASLAGMPPGAYHAMGNDVVLEPSGRLYNPTSGYLVGSSYTLLQCANVLLREHLCSREEVYDLCFHTPLALMGLSAASIPQDPLIRFDERTQTFQPTASGTA